MLNNKRKEKITELTQKLIREKSYSGEEEGVAKILKDFFKNNGFSNVFTDKYGSVIGQIKGNREGESVLFEGHMDVVPVNADEWEKDPFGGEIFEGKIFGRGSTDMKGPLAAMINAASAFEETMQGDFSGDIYVAASVHEECFEGIASREISKKINPDVVIIGEPSNLDIKIGQKGRAEIKLEVFGKSSHSGTPEKGINAVYQMLKLVERVKELKPVEDKTLGVGIMELVDIKSSPYPGASVVPDYCLATYDRRLLVGETKESVLEPLNELIEEMKKEDTKFNAKVSYSSGRELCYTGESIAAERFFPAWEFEKEDDFVQKIYKGMLSNNLKPKIDYYPFCTNGSHYAGEKNIKTIGYGPSREDLAHTVDEYIEIEQLIDATKGYYAILEALLK